MIIITKKELARVPFFVFFKKIQALKNVFW